MLGLHTRVRVTDLGLGWGYTQNDKVALIRFISYLQRNIYRVLLWYMYMNIYNKQGLGLAGLGLHTRVRVTDLGLG